jgi:hypothetical protein
MSVEIFLLGATSPGPRALACAEAGRATRSGWRRTHAEQVMITHPPAGETRSPVRPNPASRTTSRPTDTITDLADGFLGAAIGGVLLIVWALARYTSRRVPSGLGRDMQMTPPQARAVSGTPRAC